MVSQRGSLTRERVIAAAAAVADRAGLASVSMRSVGAELGVEGMSLYHHVASKEALLDALAEWVVAKIELPPADAAWRPAMEVRARSARQAFVAHPWSIAMIESRPSPSAALLTHHDRVLAWLFAAGFTAAQATLAFSTVDAFIYGFALSESNMPFDPRLGAEADFAAQVSPDPARYPHLARSLAELLADGGYAYADEFDAGLTLILDAIESRVAPTATPPRNAAK